jgi:glycine cleavage system aminomethyltransferase T/glycine/D-amino acid oxidase-like deaminating enzyme
VTVSLPSHAEIVVIGGGIIGCSTAYHLARDHRADVVVLEQNQLTSGSTWHAAGLVGQLRSSASITQLLKYSVELYGRLEAETGLATGWKMTGCLRLACNADRWTEFKRLATTARSFGMEMQLLSPAEVKAMWPLMTVDDLVGASFLPSDGQASPSDIAQALAKGARAHGAVFHEGVRVEGFDIAAGRVKAVRTGRGTIACDKVVNCAGLWARDVGVLAGVSVPLQAVMHQYLITEPIPGLARDIATVRDPDRRTYFKEEVGGLVMGGYEPDPRPWAVDPAPADFAFQLFADDWQHFEQHMVAALARVPALETTGVKRMIHGPESFTPDGNFILGRAPELDNFYVGAGFNAFGIASAGGAGWALAGWVVDGEAPLDLWIVDIRRFAGLHRDRAFVSERTLEAYGRHYAIAYPHEEYESGRPRLISPLYGRLRARHACFGSKLGWERANWFAANGSQAHDLPSMGRQNWFAAVGEEHRAVRGAVGLFDQSSFAKFELTGPDAGASLSLVSANDVTRPPGRITYTQLLNRRGGIEADITVARLAEDRYYIVTGTGFRTHDFGWIRDHLPKGADVALSDVTEAYATLSLMGPRSRAVLACLTDADLSNQAFPFGHAATIAVAAIPARVLRVTYVGELGYELHVPTDAAAELFDAVMAAGSAHGLKLAGYRAIESLRLEKFYRAWGSDITANDTPFEAGLGSFVKLGRGLPFIGREALEEAAGKPLRKRLCGFTTEDCDVVLSGRETILRDGEFVGYLTSGGYGYTVRSPIGLGYVRNMHGVSDDWLNSGRYALVVANDIVPARLHRRPLYDPEGLRVRG